MLKEKTGDRAMDAKTFYINKTAEGQQAQKYTDRQYIRRVPEKEDTFKNRIKTGTFDGLYFKELF